MVHLELDEQRDSPLRGESLDLVALDEALTRFGAVSERAARVVECRFFGGLTVEETGVALDISPVTVKRDWLAAKGWFRREMQ